MDLLEKYEPSTLDKVVGHEIVIESIKEQLKTKDISVFLFVGPAGTGKTTTAKNIARELFGNCSATHYKELNASDERGIKVVRETIKTVSRQQGKRIICLEEADNMTKDAQQALRRIMEKKAKGTIFILTGNYPNKIIDPIKSRCGIYRFKPLAIKDIKVILGRIIKGEQIKFNKELHSNTIKTIARRARGDARKAITGLAQITTSTRELKPELLDQADGLDNVIIALQNAINGDGDGAIEEIENAYIQSANDHISVIRRIQELLPEVVKDVDVRMRIYSRLSDVLHYCESDREPIIHLGAFMTFVWISKHLPKRYPICGEKV